MEEQITPTVKIRKKTQESQPANGTQTLSELQDSARAITNTPIIAGPTNHPYFDRLIANGGISVKAVRLQTAVNGALKNPETDYYEEIPKPNKRAQMWWHPCGITIFFQKGKVFATPNANVIQWDY